MANNNAGGVIGTILALVIMGSFKSCMRGMYSPNNNTFHPPSSFDEQREADRQYHRRRGVTPSY
ncbi:hypothetical protein [Cuspidothrix issatschenkoi]|uniref:Uncharacterized protein n=1 Tax=Cuspidothrix issatschenkoi CHARLIE-1 TaxID=2052836 RepID=A0A2S6CRN5_9CYAN|nr:hypothetical protein [Cuspidothrix issatschenkoi]PPJ62357.1 hypothetical protein CUN59_16070 [Cuspidothrix issatschenkoi CHARLIE-1]